MNWVGLMDIHGIIDVVRLATVKVYKAHFSRKAGKRCIHILIVRCNLASCRAITEGGQPKIISVSDSDRREIQVYNVIPIIGTSVRSNVPIADSSPIKNIFQRISNITILQRHLGPEGII